LNAQTGAATWSYPVERFVATAVGSDNNKPVLWHVSGDAKDYAAIRLNRIDIASGDQKPIPTWRRPARIEQAWIAVASHRVLVGTAPANPVARTVDVGIDGIDLETRKIVWMSRFQTPRVKNCSAHSQFLPRTRRCVHLCRHAACNIFRVEWFGIHCCTGCGYTAVIQIVNEETAQVIDPKTGNILAKHPIL
jgi:hypothetical protein